MPPESSKNGMEGNEDISCFIAARDGNVDALAALLADGADANNAKPSDGWPTPCYVAAYRGHVGAIRLLIDHGVDYDKATADEGKTPCYLAAQHGHVAVVELLLTAGANPNKATTDVFGVTPCHIAAKTAQKWHYYR